MSSCRGSDTLAGALTPALLSAPPAECKCNACYIADVEGGTPCRPGQCLYGGHGGPRSGKCPVHDKPVRARRAAPARGAPKRKPARKARKPAGKMRKPARRGAKAKRGGRKSKRR